MWRTATLAEAAARRRYPFRCMAPARVSATIDYGDNFWVGRSCAAQARGVLLGKPMVLAWAVTVEVSSATKLLVAVLVVPGNSSCGRVLLPDSGFYVAPHVAACVGRLSSVRVEEIKR